ncbi:hypothetical protein [Nocardioides zhouii]|uniref:Uncharacterized protein n=1 Tax=Nocardioides zhouii TaxID=1168729 RepID=A0A4Q2T9J8_9ACTN|nr:hypothetical protein [Nocardioides zhouii]RYC13784.1 hypothetical protein EUA94_04090 [Nocardioides zhouii]
MESDGEPAHRSGRTSTVVLGVLWAILGAWLISSGDTGPGVGMLLLAGAYGLAFVSPRVEAFMYTPIFRRKK